jgi:hypothetical protein
MRKPTAPAEAPVEEATLPHSLGKIVKQIVAQKTQGIDPLDVEELEVWAAEHVRRLLNHLNVKIWHKRQRAKPIEVNRTQYVAACKILGIAESPIGKPIELDEARIAKRVLLPKMHPDTNGGDTSKVNNFNLVLDAYDAIVSYSKILSKLDKKRRPYRKRPKDVAQVDLKKKVVKHDVI